MYLIVKSLHVVAVMSWFAGLVYLGRVLIYHREAAIKQASSEQCDTFTVMESRAWAIICNPAMIVSVVSGLYLAYVSGAFTQGWFHSKFALVILLIGYHFHTNKFKKAVTKDIKAPTVVFLKVWNEILTGLVILIVFLVITKNSLYSILGFLSVFFIIGLLMLIVKYIKNKKH